MNKRICCYLLALAIPIFLFGCGGGSSSSPSTGTVSIGITDAKPLLPSGTTQVLITFDEVSVHRAGGGGWTSPPLAQTPYAIDLLQFSDGTATDLVPPVELLSGKYTQIRIGVIDATITISGVDYPVEISSEDLKTDKQFDFEVVGGGAVDLTVDFDLSQSIVVTGPNSYKLKPVLHINHTQEAATIQGSITDITYATYGSSEAFVTVYWDKNGDGFVDAGDEEYTSVIVTQGSPSPTEFRIFWLVPLVPNEGYIVQVEIGGVLVLEEAVDSSLLQAGDVFVLNGSPI